MEELQRIITFALKDGLITVKERELILKKAHTLKIDEIEAEMLLEGMISDYENKMIAAEKLVEINLDGYFIEDGELILRTSKWVDRCSEKKIKITVLPFPKQIVNVSKFDNAMEMTGKIAFQT